MTPIILNYCLSLISLFFCLWRRYLCLCVMVLMGILNESCVEISLQKDGNENTSETLNSWNKIWCSAVIVQHEHINMLLNQGNPYTLKITFRNKNGRRQSLLHQFILLVLLLPRLPELLFVKWLRYRRLRGPATLPKSFHTVIRVFFFHSKIGFIRQSACKAAIWVPGLNVYSFLCE